MNFFYQASKKPNNDYLKIKINEAANRLYSKLVNYDIKGVEISEYNRRYFGNKIKNPVSIYKCLQKYSFLLLWSLSSNQKPLENVVFMDYGGGHGMLSLLAKELKIGTVIHTDIFEISCYDAKTIGESLNIPADYYIPGDIDEVIEFLRAESISCDAISNFDVIEHIYDISKFFDKIKLLTDDKIEIFFASGANSLNSRINKRLMKQHLEFEYKDRGYKFGRKPTDTTKALFELRKDLIRSAANSKLKEDEIELLSRLTRGFLVDHIKAITASYVENKKLPKPIKHPTNTCDPFTGNWFEHLMDPFELKKILDLNGFETSIYSGYYSTGKTLVRSVTTFLLNLLITFSSNKGLRIAPFYAIHAIKK
ncbi:MAG: hypothetical protein GF353_03365 [Candidatus Lokiarchaeota archaeon]|nr:hypothetical protein [Candidatus Lokiarchaeota archaeon]